MYGGFAYGAGYYAEGSYPISSGDVPGHGTIIDRPCAGGTIGDRPPDQRPGVGMAFGFPLRRKGTRR